MSDERRTVDWPSDTDAAMSALAVRFPSLVTKQPLGVEPWDANAFLSWLCSTGLSHGELLAARFVLGVWNPSTPWEELAREKGHPFPDNARRFDVFEAIGVWDRDHVAAFVSWVGRPFWP